jgi:hypothetical protein
MTRYVALFALGAVVAGGIGLGVTMLFHHLSAAAIKGTLQLCRRPCGQGMQLRTATSGGALLQPAPGLHAGWNGGRA